MEGDKTRNMKCVNKHYSNEAIQRWYQDLDNVTTYVSTNHLAPKETDPDPDIAALGRWLFRQKVAAEQNIGIIGYNSEIRSIWHVAIVQNKLMSSIVYPENDWFVQFNRLKGFVDEHNCYPSPFDNIPETRKLVDWIVVQKRDYETHTNFMEDSNVRLSWYNMITDPKYESILCTQSELWNQKCTQFEQFLQNDSNGFATSMLRLWLEWVAIQKNNFQTAEIYYNNEDLVLSPDNDMRDPSIYTRWKLLRESPEFAQL
jgi:hypothetical protein